MSAPRCPLGFTGEMPVGHPPIPGFMKSSPSGPDAKAGAPAVDGSGTSTRKQGSSAIKTYAWLAFDAALILLVALAVIYHDRPAFVAARSDLAVVKPAYPLIGNLPLIRAAKRKAGNDEDGLAAFVLQGQQTAGKGGLPFTFATLDSDVRGRAVVLNRLEYIQSIKGAATGFYRPVKGGSARSSAHLSFLLSSPGFREHARRSTEAAFSGFERLIGGVKVDTTASLDLSAIFSRLSRNLFTEIALGGHPGDTDSQQITKLIDAAETARARHKNSKLWLVGNRFSPSARALHRTEKAARLAVQKVAAKDNAARPGADAAQDLLAVLIAESLDDEERASITLDFILDGSRHLAHALSATLLELDNRADIVDKIRAEARADSQERISSAQAAVSEASRLRPADPIVILQANRAELIRPRSTTRCASCKILPDVRIDESSSVVWSEAAMARMPEVWGDDSELFKPERMSGRDASRFEVLQSSRSPAAKVALEQGAFLIAQLVSQYNISLQEESARTLTAKVRAL